MVTDPDIVPLRHGCVAIYVRDTDLHSIALRRLARRRDLTAAQAESYEQWLAEQYQDAS